MNDTEPTEIEIEQETLVSVYAELNHGIVDKPMTLEEVIELV